MATMSTDDRDRDRDIQNARLLADRAHAGDLDPCEWCHLVPTIR